MTDNRKAEQTALIYAGFVNAAIPAPVIVAAVRSGKIRTTHAGKVDKKSFASFLDSLGFAGAADRFRTQYKLKRSKRLKGFLDQIPTGDKTKLEIR